MLKLSAICAFCALLHITGVESPRLPCQRAPVRVCHCEVHGEIRELEEKILVFYSDKWLRDAANALNDFLESPTAVYGHPSSSSACSLGSHHLRSPLLAAASLTVPTPALPMTVQALNTYTY